MMYCTKDGVGRAHLPRTSAGHKRISKSLHDSSVLCRSCAVWVSSDAGHEDIQDQTKEKDNLRSATINKHTGSYI